MKISYWEGHIMTSTIGVKINLGGVQQMFCSPPCTILNRSVLIP